MARYDPASVFIDGFAMRVSSGFLAIAVSAVLLLPAPALQATGAPSAVLEDLAATFWQAREIRFPELPAADGRYPDSGRIGAVSEAGYAHWLAYVNQLQRRLASIEPATLAGEDRARYKQLAVQLAADRIEFGVPQVYLRPLSEPDFYSAFLNLMQRAPLATLADYEKYLQRLARFESYADQNTDLLSRGVVEGHVHRCEALAGIVKRFDAPPPSAVQGHILLRPFTAFPPGIAAEVAARLRETAFSTMSRRIVPSLLKVQSFLRGRYIPFCRRGPASNSDTIGQ